MVQGSIEIELLEEGQCGCVAEVEVLESILKLLLARAYFQSEVPHTDLHVQELPGPELEPAAVVANADVASAVVEQEVRYKDFVVVL